MKKITVVGKPPIDYVYVIRDIDVDRITLEKFQVECRTNIDSAWGIVDKQITFSEAGEQNIEVILKDKISNVTMFASANVIEMASKMGGKIIKDIKVERAKRGKKVYLIDLILFKEAI